VVSPAAERGTSDVSLQSVQAAMHERAAKEFRLGLMKLWEKAGKPTSEVMAQRTQIPKSVFDIFLTDKALPLPSRREVEAILEGLGIGTRSPAAAPWFDRFIQLEQQRAALDQERIARNRAAHGLPPQQQPEDLADLVGEPIDVRGPLAAALEATTREQLQAALGELRAAAKLSVRRVAEITGTVPGDLVLSRSTVQRIEKDERMPTRQQVLAFAKACGQDQREQRLWGRAADRVAQLAAGGPDPADAGQVEVSLRTHPVRYLGKAADDQRVLQELRVQVTPTLKTAAYSATGVTALALSGLVLKFSKPNSPARLVLGVGVGIGAGAAALQVRKRINAMTDEDLKRTIKVLLRVAAEMAELYARVAVPLL
jgi:transcriptional regulator with XRE-family HTH domain